MKVAVYTLGCKVNIYESEYVIDLLKNNGYEIVDFESNADIYIINTCTITNGADKKDRKIINSIRKNHPKSCLVVMGCYSQAGNKIDADIIIGNKDKSKIISLLEEYNKNKEKINRIYDIRNICFENMNIQRFENHTRAFVKIQDGCNAFCSYCIIPYIRGNIRSKNFNDVILEIKNLVNNGYKEIVLTGIHTGRYGIDIGTTLENLIKELIKIPNLHRIRLSSIEINEITDGIIEIMKNNNKLAHHLHIPLQSGSDKILKLMNRKYDMQFFKEKIEVLRKEIPDISITTDLIVGFPNEDEDCFKETINNLHNIKFTHIHTFPYSKRDGTKAAEMINQVEEIIKKQRVKEVMNISQKYEELFYKDNINHTYDIITEQRKDGMTVGYTSNYIPIIINDNINNNKIVYVKIEKENNLKTYGKLVK